MHSPHATEPRPAWQARARGSRKKHDPIPPCAAPTLPHAGRWMRRTHHHYTIAAHHWSPWSSAIKANTVSLNPQPVRRCRWWHSTTPRQAKREGGGRSKEEKEATAEPDLAGATSATPIGYSDVAARHGTASPHHGLALPPHRHPTATSPTVSHVVRRSPR